jgi:hypothetical protein
MDPQEKDRLYYEFKERLRREAEAEEADDLERYRRWAQARYDNYVRAYHSTPSWSQLGVDPDKAVRSGAKRWTR